MTTTATFDPTLWTPARATAFARGLWHVAASDGIADPERELLTRFLAATGAPTDLTALLASPFDFSEARRELDSQWIRRLLIQASRGLAELDGGISDEERDALRALGLGLGVGERLALQAPSFAPVTPETLMAWLATRPVDWISWDDEAQRAIFWRFPSGHARLADRAKVMVNRGQALVIHHGGTLHDVLHDGIYELSPETAPGLSAATGWQGGPVDAELTFVSMSQSETLRWGSVDPTSVPASPGSSDEVPLRAFGRFVFRIADATKAFTRFCRTGLLPSDEVEARVRRMAAGRFGEGLRAMATGGVGADRLLNDPAFVLERTRPVIDKAFAEAGLQIRRFELESITGPLELEIRTTHGGRGIGSFGVPAPSAGLGQGGSSTPSGSDAAVTCYKCLSAAPINARFCPNCGAAQRQKCAGCGHEAALRARFCPQCGLPQPGPPPPTAA